MAMNITLVSYNNMLDFGIIACRRSVPGVQRMVDYMEEALVELEDMIGSKARPPARKLVKKTVRKTVKKKTPTKKAVQKKALTKKVLKKKTLKKKALKKRVKKTT